MHNSSKTKPFSPRKRAESSANYQKNAKRKRTQSNSLKKVTEDDDCMKIMLGDGESVTVLNDLRQRGQLCDGVIKTEDGKEFKIHRAVVSAASPYFRALFTNPLSDVETTEIIVPSLKSEILTLILDYAYTGNVNVTKSNVEELLPAADLTQVTGVVQQCCDYLAKELRIENCVGIYLIAKHYFCPALEAAAKNFIMIHFTMTSRISSEFPHLSFDDLMNILRSDDLNVSNEKHVFEAIIRWTQFNSRDRRKYLSNLLTTVRFGLCESSFVVSTVQKHPLVSGVRECAPLVTSARALQYKNIGKGVSDILNPMNPMCRPRVPHEVLFAVGGWSSEGTISFVETFDIRANRWFIGSYGDNMPRAYHGIVTLDQLIYMVGGFDGNQCFSSVRCFDPVTQVWSDRSCMHLPRCYVSVTTSEGMIYAIGGYDGRSRHNSCERYNPSTNQWTMIAHMHKERSDASAAAFKEKVYVVGGFTGQEILNSAEVYDSKTNEWTYIQHMQNPRSGVSLDCTSNALYVLGGFNGTTRLSSVERYDSQRNMWREVASMHTTRSNFTTALIEGTLYVIGGFDGSTTIPNAEYYDEQSNEWIDAPSMNINRSALCACVLRKLPNSRAYTYLGNAY